LHFLPVLCLAGLLSGCGPPPEERKIISFRTAEQATVPVTVEGRPEAGTIREETGKGTEFTLFEEASANRMQVSAPAGVAVPSNLKSATSVVVTGTYDAKQRKVIATEVRTKVPTREQQH
jgi:hypothetical protein